MKHGEGADAARSNPILLREGPERFSTYMTPIYRSRFPTFFCIWFHIHKAKWLFLLPETTHPFGKRSVLRWSLLDIDMCKLRIYSFLNEIRCHCPQSYQLCAWAPAPTNATKNLMRREEENQKKGCTSSESWSDETWSHRIQKRSETLREDQTIFPVNVWKW